MTSEPATPLPGIGRRLRRLRLLRGWKQGVLAEAAGVTQATVSRWESGELEPGPEAGERLMALLARPAPGADSALRRLVEASGLPMHLVADTDHRLLAVSPPRLREWGPDKDGLRGTCLWRFATAEIEAEEARLADRGWWDAAVPDPVRLVTGQGTRGLNIVAGPMLWERLYLADGTPVRLCTSPA